MPGYDFNRARMGLPQQQAMGAQFRPMMPPMMPQYGAPMQWGPTGPMPDAGGEGNWLTGAKNVAGNVGNWLTQDDNGMQLVGMGLGAYGAYKEGKARDDEIREERRRRDEELEGKRNAAASLSPLIQAIMAQSMGQR